MLLASPVHFIEECLQIPLDRFPAVGLIDGRLQFAAKVILSIAKPIEDHFRFHQYERRTLHDPVAGIESSLKFFGKGRCAHSLYAIKF